VSLSVKWTENFVIFWLEKLRHQSQKSCYLQQRIKPFEVILQILGHNLAQ